MIKLILTAALTLGVIFGLATRVFSQELPSAPSTVQPVTKPTTCGRYHWSCWPYPPRTITNREVFQSKAFWATWLGDLAISSFDAEMSKAGQSHHRCVEGGEGLSRHPTRRQLYLNNWQENAAVGVVTFIWLKVKGPKYVLPAFLGRPAYVHLKAGLSWYQDCW